MQKTIVIKDCPREEDGTTSSAIRQGVNSPKSSTSKGESSPERKRKSVSSNNNHGSNQNRRKTYVEIIARLEKIENYLTERFDWLKIKAKRRSETMSNSPRKSIR